MKRFFLAIFALGLLPSMFLTACNGGELEEEETAPLEEEPAPLEEEGEELEE